MSDKIAGLLLRIDSISQMKYFLIFIFLFSISTFAQDRSEQLIKYSMIPKLAENIEWPVELKIDRFILGVTHDNENEAIFDKMEKSASIQGKRIVIKKFDKASSMTGIHIAYLRHSDIPGEFRSIFDRLSAANVLVITDGEEDKKNVMINFFQENKRVKFEINKLNIINAGLYVKPKLILLGGSEIDLATLYKNTKEDLEKEKSKVSEQKQELAKMRDEIEAKKKEIENQQLHLEAQKEEISIQNKALSRLHFNIKKQEKLWEEKVVQFEDLQKKLLNDEKAIKEKESIIKAGNQELHVISQKIDLQKKQLSSQNRELIKQYSVIKLQKNLIYLFAGFLVLILLLAYLIFKSYRNQKKFNLKLAEKNFEISTQKEKLELQTTNLNKANNEIGLLYNDLKDNIRAAQMIQQSILPSHQYIAKFFPEFFVLNKPKDVVSGDFYWFDVTEDQIIFAAADCTGHGVSGALMSMIGHNLLQQSITDNKSFKASEILDRLNEGIKKEFYNRNTNEEIQEGMDIAVCVISKDKKKLQFAGANNPLYILRNNNLIQIKPDRFSIGFTLKSRKNTFTNNEFELHKGDIIYLFSDGYPDQMGGKDGLEKFMYPRFRELFQNIGSEEMAEQMIRLDQTIEQWRGNTEQLDDILVMGFKA